MSEALQIILVLCLITGFAVCASAAVGKILGEIIIRHMWGKE